MCNVWPKNWPLTLQFFLHFQTASCQNVCQSCQCHVCVPMQPVYVPLSWQCSLKSESLTHWCKIKCSLKSTGREKLCMEGNAHTHHTDTHSSPLPVYWTIGPINRWLWGGHVKPSDWLRCIWLLIAWHPCSYPRLLAPALETGQWGDSKQQLLCGLTLLEGIEVGGWMDGWQHQEYSMGIHRV